MNGSCPNGCDRGIFGEKCDKGTRIKNKSCLILYKLYKYYKYHMLYKLNKYILYESYKYHQMFNYEIISCELEGNSYKND